MDILLINTFQMWEKKKKDKEIAHVVKKQNICYQQHEMLKHRTYYRAQRHIIMMLHKHIINNDKSTLSRSARSITAIQIIEQT